MEVAVHANPAKVVELRITRSELRGRLTSESEHRLRTSDRVDLGDGCFCSLVKILTDRVHLGFDTPKSVPVHRKEVYEAIRREMRDGRGGA